MPAVSIVVPNYNHARFLRRRVESVLRQTYQDFEVILLDDCSMDESREVLAEFAAKDSRVRVELNAENSGTPFKQWNKGVRLARGKFVWLAESDDYADEKLLARLVAELERDDKIAFAYCRSWRVDEDDRVNGFGDWYLDEVDPVLWKCDFRMNGRDFCRRYFSRSPVVANASAAVFRREIYLRVGGADEGLRLCGDWKLWAALAWAGDVAFVSEPMNYFRYHLASVRNKNVRDANDVIEKLGVMRWISEQVPLSAEEMARVHAAAAEIWVPAMMSLRVPMSVKRKIWASAKAIDPHPVRRTVRPAAHTVELKIARHRRALTPVAGKKGL
jgi:glycosyltransferase involved in cell wall biosynthesis